MEEVPDMDDLLDEMESDLIQRSRIKNPRPQPLPTSIGMQPQAEFRKGPPSPKVVTLSKFQPGAEMNEQMEGHINIDTSRLPNTFNPSATTWTAPAETTERAEKENTMNANVLPASNGNCQSTLIMHKENVVDRHFGQQKRTPSPPSEPEVESDPEPEPEDVLVSEVEEDTLVPETQIISNVNVTVQDSEKLIPAPAEGLDIPKYEQLELDTEMESMLEYLNGFEEANAASSTGESEEQRKNGGRDSISEVDDSMLSEFADKLSAEVVNSALKHSPRLHYDPAIQEFYETTDTTQEIFAMSLDETQSSMNSEAYLSEPEPKKERMPSVVEEESECDAKQESEVQVRESVPIEQEDKPEETTQDESTIVQGEVPQEEEEAVSTTEHAETSQVIDSVEETAESEEATVPIEVPEVESGSEVQVASLTPTNTEEQLDSEVSVGSIEPETIIETTPESLELEPSPPESDNSLENVQSEEQEEIVEVPVFDETPVEQAHREDIRTTIAVTSCENDDSSLETGDEETENRPRFDSSIATIHVLHESDSDESGTVRRERRLTESELQLGKTSPYWIPDSECPNCMLCNAKFTIITRRHHCRACGRVLCGSCCNEKAVLEYLQEAGKKPQAVRVCKPCSSMLSRIEIHEQEERTRRESVTSDVDANSDDTPAPAVVPRGVLKTRASTQGNDEEGTSTSSTTPSAGGLTGDSSRRSVMFRDGVRPGAPADGENPEEERSTALKPKKKSRKRTAVVRRIAELKMEDELACALPKDGKTKLLIIKPESDQPKFEDACTVLETLCNFSIVTVVLKKNLNCTVQIFNNPNFGLIWAVSTQGFAQIGLDELLFAWNLNDREKQRVEAEEPELDETVALSYLPLAVLRRISTIYMQSTEYEFAGVRRVESRVSRVHSTMNPEYPLTKHVMFFRPTVQVGLNNLRIPSNPFLVACFLNDEELNWATGLPNRLLYKLGEKYNVYPTPFVNDIGRPSLYSNDFSGTVLKVFTDFRSWSYRMRPIPGCTVSLTNDKTIIRIPKSALSDLKEILSFSRSMVAWSVDLNHDDDSVLVCEESDPGIYSTQVFAKYIGQRESTSASFVILDGGSKVNSLQVNVVEDGVAIRVQSERLETILNAINDGHDVVETSKDMEFRVEFVEDGDWITPGNEYYPKSEIDDLYLMNKFQYGLSLERALTQVLQVQGISDYGVRMSHVYNLGDGRLQPEEEPKIYGMVEIAAKECVAMLEPHMQYLIRAGIGSVSIRLFVSPYEFEYEVSKWLGLEEENSKYKQSLDQLIPILYNMVEYVPNGFEVEFVLSIVSTKALPI